MTYPRKVLISMAKTSEAQIKASNKYIKENMKEFKLKLNKVTEPELLAWIEQQENKQGYIKSLILADMKFKNRN